LAFKPLVRGLARSFTGCAGKYLPEKKIAFLAVDQPNREYPVIIRHGMLQFK
jgi:hypothetical protein